MCFQILQYFLSIMSTALQIEQYSLSSQCLMRQSLHVTCSKGFFGVWVKILPTIVEECYDAETVSY
jgi:hypothetical protein